MTLTLRARLTLMYSFVVIITLFVFGVVLYYTVSAELYTNLDASLQRVATSLEAVINREKSKSDYRPKLQPRSKRVTSDDKKGFAFLIEKSLMDFVGPVTPYDIDEPQRPDPVWSAVYEHILLNSSMYVIQVSDSAGSAIWKSDAILGDSLPTFRNFVAQGLSATDTAYLITFYTFQSARYRLIAFQGVNAQISMAYPIAEIDATLRRLFSMMLYSLPLAALVSLVLGWTLAQRSLKPVDEVTRSARMITAENLAKRLPTSGINDEIGRLTNTLNEMIARLEQSFNQIQQFTADASHELRTPLAILMGEIELALRTGRSTEEYQSVLRSALEEVERLSQVVQGLLELSRADSGQILLEMKPTNLNILIGSICDNAVVLSAQKNIDLRIDIADNLVIMADRIRLYQALLNIVENAVKYTPDGGRVMVRAYPLEKQTCIEITDTGIGIPAEDIPHLFDRFYRADRARTRMQQGAGLGLSIASWVIDAHGGQIDISSVEGQGTTVKILLSRTSS